MSTFTKGRALLCGCSLLISSVALADGRLEGRVVAAGDLANLAGAQVRIENIDRSAATGKDGRFSFGHVPAGQYTLIVEYLGAPSSRTAVTVNEGATESVTVVLGENVDEIVVRGDRRGRADALNRQRSSDTIISVVSADDIGALPDGNVAEAVQRVPGVFLERDQGEGRYIGIRGMDPNLNTTTINGLFVPSPDSGARSVALDVIPSDLLASLEIVKTFTPDMDASAIGGNVNVRSLSAFDRQGPSFTITTEGSYNELVEETSPKVAGSFTDTYDLGDGTENFGVAIAASWFDRDFGTDNIETDGGWPSDIETVGGAEFKGAEEIEQRSYTVNRERVGLAVNFDWRGENSDFYWRNLYSDFSDQESRDRNEFKFDDGDAISGSSTSAQWEDAVIEKSMKDRLEEQTILSVLVGGETRLDQWTFDYSYGYSMGEEAEPNRLDTTFEGEDLDIGYDRVGQIPNLTAEAAAYDAATYELAEFEFLDGKAEDEANTINLNATYDLFSNAYNGNIQFGVQQRTRSKDYDATVEIYDGPDDVTLADFANSGPRYGIGTFTPGIRAGDLRSYFFANRNNLELDDEDTLVESTAGDYDMDEDVLAAYLMSTYETGNWHVVYGVRYEDTDFKANGQRIVVNDITGSGDPEAQPVSFSQAYDHVLPSINVRYTSGDFVFRAAATQTISRPNFEELRPGGEIEFETDDNENVLEAEIGNPNLQPVESTNFDFGVEWYPGGVSVISAGVFYKDLDNFIVIADVGDSIDLSALVGDVPIDDPEVIQPINGDSAELFGVELAIVQQFDNGFFFSANGTFVDSEARYPDRDGTTQLPRTPDTVLNGAIGWENETFSLRLAATYRDDALQEFEELDDPDFDIYQDTHTQLDLSAKWNVTDQLQLSFAAINLTDEPFYNYFGSRQYNAQYEEYGRTLSLGFRYTPY